MWLIMKHQIDIVIGSTSDIDKMQGAIKVFKEAGIDYKLQVASAHRTPELALKIATTAKERGVAAIIAGAGMAAHLAGVIAGHTAVPVIGVPLSGSPVNGFDSLLSTVQMPPGIPVATVGIDNSTNAAMLALQIIGNQDEEIYNHILAVRKKKQESIIEANKTL